MVEDHLSHFCPFHRVYDSEQSERILTNTDDNDDDEGRIWRDRIIIREIQKQFTLIG